jgi:hypothetical protein
VPLVVTLVASLVLWKKSLNSSSHSHLFLLFQHFAALHGSNPQTPYQSTMALAAVADLAVPEVVPESRETQSNKTVPQLFSLAGDTTLITGGGRGLGLELSHAVFEAGGSVACIDILTHETIEADMAALQKYAILSSLHALYHKAEITNEPTFSASISRS